MRASRDSALKALAAVMNTLKRRMWKLLLNEIKPRNFSTCQSGSRWIRQIAPGQAVCVRLSGHSHFNVRGNANFDFGHLARTCRTLDELLVKPLIEAAFHDPNEYVRGRQTRRLVMFCSIWDGIKVIDLARHNKALQPTAR